MNSHRADSSLKLNTTPTTSACLGAKDKTGAVRSLTWVSVHLRPPEIEDRQFPRHWEGDLIKGAANASAVGTLVERTSKLLMLIKLPEFNPSMMQAFSDRLLGIAAPMRQSMTKTQDRELAMHKELNRRTDIAVYFRDTHSPWQRGSNENTNGLVRRYLPKGTDLSGYSQQLLDAMPRKSTTDPERAWAHDHPWRSIENSCSTARNIPPSFIEPQGVALQT